MRLKQIRGFKIKPDAGNGFYVETEVNGQVFTIDGFDAEFVVHKHHVYDFTWVVSERSTGVQISSKEKEPAALSKYEAIAAATTLLNLKKGIFKTALEKARKNLRGPVVEITSDGNNRAVAKV